MKIGVITHLRDTDADAVIKKVHDLGIDCCQLGCWNHSILTPETAEAVKAACERYGVSISTVWVGWSGPTAWNFTEGPSTIGLVPPMNRLKYLDMHKKAVDFCVMAGIPAFHSHFGFIPDRMQ